ncbi:MAG: ATP-binding cassette domain-containing protein [Tannerella sp.]|jgi:ABC-type multidrug transport system ATPase subunit|nr:ATP-binding cassette domain-containing protein [Tannerella sp.]
MNETILNGLLNLFALFASIVRIDKERAVRTVHNYLGSHFGVRSQHEYIELYKELRGLYDDTFYAVDKHKVAGNICRQMKAKLTQEEQLLLLVRFLEFASQGTGEFEKQLSLFRSVAEVFNIPEGEFADALAFVTGKGASPHLLYILSPDATRPEQAAILREGMEGEIRVWYVERFDLRLFTYEGKGTVFLNNIPVTPGIFYNWQHSSVVKGPRFHPVYFSDLTALLQGEASQEAIRLCGRHVNFSYSNSPAGLHDFSFDLASGQFVALMGGSGVGKSTLMGLLNGSIIPDSGSITANGHPIGSAEARLLLGFVPQDDLLVAELSVYDNLRFTARLCFDGIAGEELARRVDTTLRELDLYEIKDLPVGSPLDKTISGGQRKRLNIALELIREPAILYLDEPTSGLSSSDSERVMMLLKEQTHKGKLIVANIHQPSSEIYKLFDRLWLLDKGGYPIYDGNPMEAITYFKQAARYTDPDLSVCATCGNATPELILDIVDSERIDDSGKPTGIRKFSPEDWNALYLQLRPPLEQPKPEPLPPNRQKRPPFFKQASVFFERNVRTKLPNRQYLLIALLEAPLLALIVAWLTRYVPDEGGYSLFRNKNFVSYIFMSVIVVTFIGLSVSAEEILRDRAVLKRERFLRLSRKAYLSAKMAYLFLLSGFETLTYVVVGNGLMGVGHEMFFPWWALLWLTAFLANLTGLWLSQTLRSLVAVYISIPLLLIPQILLCGLVIPFEDLSTGSDKPYVPLIGEVIPSRWSFEALAVEQYTGNAYERAFFPVEREKFLAQYYKDVELPELRAFALDSGARVRRTLYNELPVLAEAARMAPYRAGKDSIDKFFDRADSLLRLRTNDYTAYLEQLRRQRLGSLGAKGVNALKMHHRNEALGDLLTGAGEDRLFRWKGAHLYPAVGKVYFEPENAWGRAPFYSGEKQWGGLRLSTFFFNSLVLLFFAVIAIIFIFAEIPKRFLGEDNKY